MHANRKIAYINGKIFTSDRENLYAEAMTVEGGRIAWVGAQADMPAGPYDETVDLVYNQICSDISPLLTSLAREEWSKPLAYGGEKFLLIQDGVTYYVLYWGNTVVYAHAPEGSEEITDLLVKLRYIDP